MNEDSTGQGGERTQWGRVPAFARPVFFVVERASWISSIALILLAAIVVVDVVGRAFSSPLSSGSDIGAMLMVALIFFALSGTQVDKDHVSMDALVSLFPEGFRRITEKVNLTVCLMLGIVLTYGAIKTGIKSFNSGEMALGAMALPLWPGKFAVAFGFGLYSLVVLAQLLDANPPGKRQDSVPPTGAE